MKHSSGQVIIAVILLVTLGVFLIGLLLPILPTTFQSQYVDREQAMKRYAAEAAINRVVADLVRGADAIGTTYTTTSPHRPNQSYDTFTMTTSYSIPSVTVNGYTATVTIANPTPTQAMPTYQNNYVDPGVIHPHLAYMPEGNSYLMRLYNVKPGDITVTWAYQPAGISRVGVWAGMPVNPETKQVFPPGRNSRFPQDHPILDTGMSPAKVAYVRGGPITVDPATDLSGGVYTIVFDNSRFDELDPQPPKYTQPYAPSGGLNDTWIYVRSHRDYIITATVDGLTLTAYLRQVPGYAEPPVWTTPWASNNISFITNKVYVYSYSLPR